MPTKISGQPTSKEVIAELKDYGKPVILMFSFGKDSLGAWIALEEAGIEVVPVHLYLVPGMKFQDDAKAYYEKEFGVKIHQYPTSGLYRMLRQYADQPPERLRVLEAANIIVPTHDEHDALVRQDLGLPDSYIADGIRAADSLVRRTGFVKYGVIKHDKLRVSPIADWLKGELLDAIAKRGVELPIDYKIWGRTFDGTDARFTKPLAEHLPEDYAILKRWFPLIESDWMRKRNAG